MSGMKVKLFKSLLLVVAADVREECAKCKIHTSTGKLSMKKDLKKSH